MSMYVKLFTSIYQGTLRGNSHGLLVFTNLLAHADKYGVVDIHPRAISEEVGISVEQVKAALLDLEAPDEESRSPENEGRRIVRIDEHRAWGWQIVNYLKYRQIRDEEDRREQNREAQARWREKNKPASSGVSQDKPASAEVSRGKPQSAHTEAEVDTDINTARKSARLSVSDLIADGIDKQSAEDWMASRKAKSLPLTRTAWEKVKDEARKAGLSSSDAVKVAAGNGWAGFKASWMTASNPKANDLAALFEKGNR